MMPHRHNWTIFLFSFACLTLGTAGAWAETTYDPQVTIPVGEFQMGTEAGTARERPVHTVWVDAFFIDRYEISNTEYETFQPGHRRSQLSACDECPVTLVTWHEAEAFCRQRGGRLPTEAEWEKAARGPNGFAYGFGKQPDVSKANFGKEFQDGTVPVNTYAPNGYGLHQMSGNVWEWVRDWFGAYPEGNTENPTGPATGAQKVVRGGSWHHSEYYVNTGMRFKLDPNVPLNSLGFRCVQSEPQP